MSDSCAGSWVLIMFQEAKLYVRPVSVKKTEKSLGEGILFPCVWQHHDGFSIRKTRLRSGGTGGLAVVGQAAYLRRNFFGIRGVTQVYRKMVIREILSRTDKRS